MYRLVALFAIMKDWSAQQYITSRINYEISLCRCRREMRKFCVDRYGVNEFQVVLLS